MAGPYRDGRVHVLAERCPTCVFRPGNLMRLESGRVRGMVDEALANDAAIRCHSTLYGQTEHEAVCCGFFERYPTSPLQIADRLGLITFDALEVIG